MTEELVIETKGLKKTFVSKIKGKKKEVEAVKGVDLAVKKGEIFGFLGPNGAGKSTTQKMLPHYYLRPVGKLRLRVLICKENRVKYGRILDMSVRQVAQTLAQQGTRI